MKPIKEMSLVECLDFLRDPKGFGVGNLQMVSAITCAKIADRIEELTRWVPVSERLPTKEDGDERGFVLWLEGERESPHRIYHTLGKWNLFESPDDYPDYFYKVISWKRINLSDGV